MRRKTPPTATHVLDQSGGRHGWPPMKVLWQALDWWIHIVLRQTVCLLLGKIILLPPFPNAG